MRVTDVYDCGCAITISTLDETRSLVPIRPCPRHGYEAEHMTGSQFRTFLQRLMSEGRLVEP